MLKGFATRLTIDNPVTLTRTNITGEQKFQVSLSLKTSHISSFDQLDWDLLRRELSSWSASASGLIDDSNAVILFVLLQSNAPLTVSFQIGNKTCSGTAFATDLKLSGGKQGAARWSLSLKGSGLLSVS